MSAAAMVWARSQHTGCPVMKAVLCELGNGTQHDGTGIMPAVDRMARTTEFSEADVELALLNLVEAGLVAEHPNGFALAMPLDRPAYRARSPEWAALRARVFARDNFACVYCGATHGPLHVDHVVPRSRGGPDTEENLATACAPCNISKRNRTPEEWRGRRS